jgi:hypothetical protein
MNKDIETLIELALADGNITDEERAVILRKAMELGVERDEAEMIIEGRLHQYEAKRRTNKEVLGNITTCPKCAAVIGSYTTNCSYCGHEFRNIDSTHSMKDVVKRLDEAEITARKSKSDYGLVDGLLAMLDRETAMERRVYDAKSNVLQSFPIPNTREDIVEILALSVSQVSTIKIPLLIKLAGTQGTWGYRITNKNAWLALANKVVIKARILLKDDNATLEAVEHYAKQLKIK